MQIVYLPYPTGLLGVEVADDITDAELDQLRVELDRVTSSCHS